MKKLAALLCSLALTLCLALPASAAGYASTYDVSAPAAFIVNTDTNIIIYDKNSTEAYTAASLTKLMTIGLMLEQYQDQLDSVSCVAPRYVYDYLVGKNASHADIRAGESVTLRQLLYAMVLPSANEAAYIVADFMGGGSVANFVSMMNAQAARIGCTNTVFTDPCGLDYGNQTCARDVYMILRWVMEFDAFREACKTERYDMGTEKVARYSPSNPYMLQNTNKMISKTLGGEYYFAPTQGGKTGTLSDWQNFAGWHTDDGITYISVVLNSPNACDPNTYPTKRPALYETKELMKWVYQSFAIQPALNTEDPITEVKVLYASDVDHLMLYPADSLNTILPVGSDSSVTRKEFHLPESVSAPVAKGEVIGSVSLYLSGECIGTVDLLAGSDIERNQTLYILNKLADLVTSTYVRVALFLFLGLALLLVLVPPVRYFFLGRPARNVRRPRF